jgi:hypothetical protein
VKSSYPLTKRPDAHSPVEEPRALRPPLPYRSRSSGRYSKCIVSW